MPDNNPGVMSGVVGAPAQQGPVLRDFADNISIRRAIFDDVRNSARELPPWHNSLHTIKIADVDYEGPEKFHRRDIKKAVLQGGSLTRKLRGTLEMSDNNTGEVLDKKRVTLANVPYLSDDGFFTLNGLAWSLASQVRLRPGVYTRVRDNGELETHVNVAKGLGHRVVLEPESGVFRLRIGQANVPLFPLLKAMGIPKSKLISEWGPDLVAANIKHDKPEVIQKLYKKLVRAKDRAADDDEVKIHGKIADAFARMELDPEVTARTLRHPYTNMTGDAMMAITKRLLAVNRGEEDVDDRDHSAFQTVFGPEDLFSERIKKSPMSLYRLGWRATLKRDLSPFHPGFLDKAIQAAIYGSGLGQPGEQVSLFETLDQATRLTRMGEGGLRSTEMIPDSARAVQPSAFGFIDSLRTPESLAIGVDTRVASNVKKGRDGRLYTEYYDAKAGKKTWLSANDVAEKAIAFPGELESGEEWVKALVGSKIKFVKRDQVDLSVPDMERTFNQLSNLIPLKSNSKGQRIAMGGRFIAQSLPLKDPEAPLVRTALSDNPDSSYEEDYGKYVGAVRAKSGGKVLKIDDDEVMVKYDDGTTDKIELYRNVPTNRKSLITQDPVVAVGDRFEPNQLLVRSNVTDGAGATAFGKNFNVAYIPFRGYSVEDAVVLSESAANRLTSVHAYQHPQEWDDTIKKGKKPFVSLFPTKFDRRMLDGIDDDGVITPGTEVKQGDPLVLVAKESRKGFDQIFKKSKPTFSDQSLTWEYDTPGTVLDVSKTPGGVNVVVKTEAPLRVGDKLANLYGGKGVVSEILPDDRMPVNAEGKPVEILLNSLGVISRTNASQIIAAALGKIAAKTGKPYRVKDFDNNADAAKFAADELKRHGVPDTEDLVDPDTGRKIPGVFTGNSYLLKLHHTAFSKAKGRSTGGYTAEETPARGGEAGSKRFALGNLGAALSHAAHGVVRDVVNIKGQQNVDYWTSFMLGKTPPQPRVPLIHRKFFEMLRAAGINPVRKGTRRQLMALSDSDIDELAGDREIKSGDTVDWRGGLKELKDGLFDPKLTGGHGGERYSYIKLPEPYPQPVMEDAIRRTLDLTADKFEKILIGKEDLNGHTGPSAIYKALDSIDLDRAISHARQDIKSGRKSAKDKAIRKLMVLRATKDADRHPRDWMVSKVAVLPPVFRPVSLMQGTDKPLVADANVLYKDLIEARDVYSELKDQVGDVSEERRNLYNSIKAVVGLGEPVNEKTRQSRIKGLLAQVLATDSSPKYSMIQSKLLGKAVDVVGRGTITPDANYDMDTVGIPETQAWEVYRPFVVRRLVRSGVAPVQAIKMVEDQTKEAKEKLLEEMDSRPVIMDRAPTLHRYSVMAFKPQLTAGEVIRLNPYVLKGFNADFDGDAMNFNVPVSDDAIKDAYERMMPSKNLLSIRDFQAHQLPLNEFQGGLWLASSKPDPDKREQVFMTWRDAVRAWRRGDIDHDTPIVIKDRDG